LVLSIIAEILIFIEGHAPNAGNSRMKFRMDATLRFWVECEYEHRKFGAANRAKTELIAEILRDYERCGDAMRYLNTRSQIAWKASPTLLQKLADAEHEVEDDMEDLL
jgi:hypothetical protein